jgi:SAM-dependent methyltransferase
MTSPVKASVFYDSMAPYYHLLFPAGFDAAIQDHGETLGGIIKQTWGGHARDVLDVSCGIGTQALGLASKGYRVTAADISAEVVSRARREATSRGLEIAFAVADMRQAYDAHRRQFDVVLAVDNAVACLLSDVEILDALKQLYACCRTGGGCLISVHDYEKEDLTSGQVRPYPVRQVGDDRYFIFQVWDFDGPVYDLSLYVVKESRDGQAETTVMRTRSYAIKGSRLLALLRDAGFEDVTKMEYVFAQPLFVGTRKGG